MRNNKSSLPGLIHILALSSQVPMWIFAEHIQLWGQDSFAVVHRSVHLSMADSPLAAESRSTSLNYQSPSR